MQCSRPVFARGSPPFAVESISTFIDNVAKRREEQKGKDNAPFEAQGEGPGRCERFAEFEAERLCHRVNRGRNTESREGWGNFVGLRRVITGVGELWELLDRICFLRCE